ncbi:hypothetical protein VTK73DRAFT_5022 [Phialemonium thermophilum]|uniref:Uncharacterized protein n=1 Tax=Phialemonium thermophilum TaxID=223376 RepID=A0ABR3V468_9PEZI
MTAAVVELVASLSGRRRPPLPTRKSSVNVTSPDKDGDTSRNLPDPEADKDAEEAPTDPDEDEMQRRLLLSFVSCVLERYVNENDVAWAPRLLEYYNPTRLVPGRRSMLQAFREDKELLVRDAVVGNLVAVTRDLGLTTCSPTFVKQLVEGPVRNDPLGTLDETAGLDDVSLSTGGSICLVAYWVFSSAVFDADQPKPDMYIFPEHAALLGRLLQDDAQAAIQGAPGTSEAVVAIGLWLEDNKRISASPAALPTTAAPGAATTTKTTAVAVATADDEEEGRREANFMSYHHLLTLVAVYHPSLAVRNAACALAGAVLHDDPSEQDRLRILEDLLENCMFANLKACARQHHHHRHHRHYHR